MKLLPITVHFSIRFRFMTDTSWCTVRPSKHSWSWVCQSAVRRTGRRGAARSQQRSCGDWKDHKSSTPTEAGMQTLGSSWTGGFLPKEHSVLSHGLPRLLAIRVSGVVAACICVCVCLSLLSAQALCTPVCWHSGRTVRTTPPCHWTLCGYKARPTQIHGDSLEGTADYDLLHEIR